MMENIHVMGKRQIMIGLWNQNHNWKKEQSPRMI